MMQKISSRAGLVALMVVAASTAAAAQDRIGRNSGQGIPPGHLPPPGECRVWYEGRPPGQQPPPVDCREAERVAARGRNSRVIYGDDRSTRADRYPRGRNDGDRRIEGRRDDGRIDDRREGDVYRDGNRERTGRATGRAVPRFPYPSQTPGRSGYPDRSPGYPDRDRYGVIDDPARSTGYRDGVEKGREDATKRRRYEPNRHSWYRSATRGYDRRFGSKDDYIDRYREAFTAGYAEGFRR